MHTPMLNNNIFKDCLYTLTMTEKLTQKEIRKIVREMAKKGERERVVKGVKIKVKGVDPQYIEQGH
jgi:hypothetical protein